MSRKYFFRTMVIMFILGMITMYFILNPGSKKAEESNLPEKIQDTVIVKELDKALPEMEEEKDSLFTNSKDSLFIKTVSAKN